METNRKISELPEDEEVCVLLDVNDSLLHFQTTAGDLVAKGFGALEFECEDVDADEPTILVKSLKEFDALRAVFGKPSAKRLVWQKLGRPVLPAEKRASQQIQLRVTASRKEHYAAIAKASGLNLSEWMLWVCDKASGFKSEVE